jgi:hypothetical protein
MADSWVRYKLTAELLSDAHPGSGSGGGGIDALFARDRDDRPVIWASHVEGVLRDAARRLRGDREAEAFFGRAGGDYARKDRQRAVFTSLYADDHVEGRVWRSTARRAFDSRAPEDDSLRIVEYVPKGTKLVGEVELPENEVPLLQRLLKEVDALGSGRSAGAGRVRLTLAPVTPAARAVGTPTGRLRLLLTNRDPLCITGTATPGNLIPSLAFVPGRTLLGAIAAWIIGEGDRDAASPLTSGRISVSDALPVPEVPANLEAVDALPAPLSLQSKKPRGCAGDIPWWAEKATPTMWLDAWSSEQKLKRPPDDLFVYRPAANSAWTTFRFPRRVRLRNGRPDPRQAEVSLFAIEQIVEDTHFLAELRGSVADMTRLAQKLAPVLEGRRWLRVGRGGAPVEVVRLAWCGDFSVSTPAGSALLTLTSDLLVRDELLRWRTALDDNTLRAWLGDDVRIERSLQDSVTVYGFNGTSGLWRMPAVAIRRGSVFQVSGPGVARLAERAAAGDWIGERTHEGFGRFRIDTALPGVTAQADARSKCAPRGDVREEAIAETTKAWFQEHKALAERGRERKPSLSQWFDLVADLERQSANALSSRLNPTTAGERSWRHESAPAILHKIQELDPKQQPLYARFFVRWLRAAMRRRAKEAR